MDNIFGNLTLTIKLWSHNEQDMQHWTEQKQNKDENMIKSKIRTSSSTLSSGGSSGTKKPERIGAPLSYTNKQKKVVKKRGAKKNTKPIKISS